MLKNKKNLFARIAVYLSFLLILPSAVLFSSVGTAEIPLTRILGQIMLDTGLDDYVLSDWLPHDSDELILHKLRWPRILTAFFIGAALSVGGAVFQAILRNPLADPYILGLSGGAGFAVTLTIVLGIGALLPGSPLLPLAAFTGSITAVFLVYALSGHRDRFSSFTLLLAGVIVNAFFAALILFIYSIAEAEQLQGMLFWIMGSLNRGDVPVVTLVVFIGIGLVYLMLQAPKLNVLSLGDEAAMNLGIEARALKKRLFIAASVVVGAAVAAGGLIGFVGLIVPHFIRLAIGPDHRRLIPMCISVGAIFLALSDSLARTVIQPAELPVGVVTALIGAPAFLVMMRRRIR